jgi:hypothetical protein
MILKSNQMVNRCRRQRVMAAGNPSGRHAAAPVLAESTLFSYVCVYLPERRLMQRITGPVDSDGRYIGQTP